MIKKILQVLVLLLILQGVAFSSNKKISHQGKLSDSSGNPIDTEGSPITVTLRLYNETGTELWSQNQGVVFDNGVFNVTLEGDGLDNLPFNEQYYLGIQVAGDPEEMSPRHKLSASSYALGSLGDFNVEGNIGIGTSPLSASMEINHTKEAGYGLSVSRNLDANSTSASVAFLNQANTSDDQPTLWLSQAGTSVAQVIASNGGGIACDVSGSGNWLNLYGTGTGDYISVTDGATPIFHIKNSGNVGIGNAYPTKKLSVNGGNVAFTHDQEGLSYFDLYNTQATGVYAISQRFIGPGGHTQLLELRDGRFKISNECQDLTNGNISLSTKNQITFHTNDGHERMKIDRNGYVGIGTNNPDARLHIARDYAEMLNLQNTLTNGGKWQFKVGGGGWGDGEFWIADKTNGRDLHRIGIDEHGTVRFCGTENGHDAFLFESDGRGYADIGWGTFSPNIRKEKKIKNPKAKDYLEWALEDAKKPIKPYKGIPRLKRKKIRKRYVKKGKKVKEEIIEEIETGENLFNTQEEVDNEYKKYGKDISKIAIGVANWAEDADKKIIEQNNEIKKYKRIINNLTARLERLEKKTK